MSDRRIDVLCIGHACYDLVFSVDHHPAADEKARATDFVSCGGGTAANAAMTAARLGHSAALAAYLGSDIYGEQHLAELAAAGVDTGLVVRGPLSTPISAIFVKPDGRRSIVNYKGDTNTLAWSDGAIERYRPRCVLCDGHQPELAVAAVAWARRALIPIVLDADTINDGNARLVHLSDYIVASERFAQEFTGTSDPDGGLAELARLAPVAVVTLGEHGLIWQRAGERGSLPAFRVDVVDTTGAGDAFHGAFAAGVAAGFDWKTLLRYASAAGALCCTKNGARLGIPTAEEVAKLLG